MELSNFGFTEEKNTCFEKNVPPFYHLSRHIMGNTAINMSVKSSSNKTCFVQQLCRLHTQLVSGEVKRTGVKSKETERKTKSSQLSYKTKSHVVQRHT